MKEEKKWNSNNNPNLILIFFYAIMRYIVKKWRVFTNDFY